MTITRRDKRALLLLAVAALVLIIVRFSVSAPAQQPVEAAQASLPTIQKRLARVRQIAASLPARQAALKDLNAGLAAREGGMIQADTLPQAQAQLTQIMRRIAEVQSPPIEIRSTELGQARLLGGQYAEVQVPLSFECRIEQLVNLLADITTQPELLATSEVRIGAGNAEKKTIRVRLNLSGVAPLRLAPQKKGRGLL
jgi:uncharacterized protein YoxC